MKDWMASGLSALDLLVMQIDGIRIDEDLILVAAGGGGRPPHQVRVWAARPRRTHGAGNDRFLRGAAT